MFMIKKRVLDAKNSGDKTNEGRLKDGRVDNVRVGNVLLYKSGMHNSLFKVTSDPITHKTVWAGICTVGFKTLMPWCATAGECFVEYYKMFEKLEYTPNIKEATHWDMDKRVKEFVTWSDVQVR